MALDIWFPLAIYHTDLDDCAAHNQTMKDAILTLEAGVGERRFNNTAWTGDVHGVASIHDDPRFSWLREQVESHCLQYLNELGYDLSKIDLFIQRSWPVITRKDEGVGAHAHHNANVSAVYYVDVPESEDPALAGAFVVHNMSNQNEMQVGISTTATDAISDWNEMNYQRANYYPVAGRLLLFPSKQTHSVDPNQTDGIRISISFDIVMVAAQQDGVATSEFLPPSPTSWRPFRLNKPVQQPASQS